MRSIRNKRGVSPVLSVLLMIIVAVAASLVTYAWVMGYIGFTTAKAGKAVQIQSIYGNATETEVKVWVQNVGDGYIDIKNLECLYIDGVLTNGTSSMLRIESGGTAEITANLATALYHGQTIKAKVVTMDGTFNEKSYTVP